MKHSILIIIAITGIFFILLFAIKLAQLKKFSLISHNEIFKAIDKLIVIFSFITIFFCLLLNTNFIQYKVPIPHALWETISFNDFKALKIPLYTINGREDIARIATRIKVKKYNNEILIEALFYPSRSYVYYNRLFSNVLFKHEIYHFHITEYYARQMRKEILTLPDSLKLHEIKSIKYRILSDEMHMQQLYDGETEHNSNIVKQIEWQKKIDSLLNSVKDYSKTKVILRED